MKPTIYSRRVWLIRGAAGLCVTIAFQVILNGALGARDKFLLCIALGGIWFAGRGLARVLARFERGPEQEQRNRLAERLATAIERGGKIQAFALYLRPFAMEQSFYVRFHVAGNEELSFLESGAVTFDRFLQEHLNYLDIPLISIGIQRFREGAGHVPMTDEEWFDRFRKLANHATTIFIVPGTSAGILEEIHWLRENGLLGKTIFFKPERYPRHAWLNLRAFHEREGGMELPEYSTKQVSFRLSSAGRCHDLQTWAMVSDSRAMRRSVGQMRALLAGAPAGVCDPAPH